MSAFCKGFVAASFSLFAVSAVAAAGTGDTPSSPQGASSAPPAVEAAVVVKPKTGSGAASVAALKAEGVKIPRPASVPPTSLDTVAHGNGREGAESIINWDSRMRTYTTLYPNRAIVYIEYNGSALCTGYMYSPSMVVTAGHCVHTGGSAGTWRTASLYKIYPGRDGVSSPYGFCTVNRLRSVTGWTVSANPQYDYGAMRLNCTVGNTVGWFGLYDPAVPIAQPAIVTGYPGDKPLTQWTSSDKIRDASTTQISYRADTIGGNSGSPVWNDKDEALATNGAWAFGVHNYATGTFGSNANSAVRLSAARISNYVLWRDQP